MAILRILVEVCLGLAVFNVADGSLPECTCSYDIIDDAYNKVPGVSYGFKRNIDSCDENGRVECRMKCEANLTHSIERGGFAGPHVVNPSMKAGEGICKFYMINFVRKSAGIRYKTCNDNFIMSALKSPDKLTCKDGNFTVFSS
ncbi:Uncharacterised protein g5568 [Pycnogonum litorale]